MLPKADSNDPTMPGHEQLLLAVARNRDSTAFRTLFDHFAPRIKAYMRRLGADSSAAEELVQDVMMVVWLRADRFDPALASASTWIYTIARNRRIDRVRQERRPELQPDDLMSDVGEEPAPDHQFEAAETAFRLRAVIGNLPPEQADVLRLAYYEDKVHAEISAERGIPLGTVKTRLRLALVRLRRAFEEGA
ncbi:sigma-70 family RNA polymerase sigma factor [Azospirillum sp. YIM DDC1]|uniref:RNA polymerase sigma factor n=1 Tax=Azospirillum aestuarii TaxID=2802052 RepID=A0ABS1I5U7_9PROT|nr:sigma-70 family RNA polymerase sigma factor [Azospirillum aestuarii]MBK3775616.1 sigma-70 family RNA polymerase sigma factor [Azospirillum brasilense]MBK4722454.1 sigma-70 family RNA polymerase sigma factor [Azospirillum aestuarii]TWA80449.1 RNA polymerase sigma-70 factor (ECF subfamily) [Azospirillum brasilense]